jgi:Asp-tRNA(Asn)/Glu-tRNA(Gln) amidotransferase A subunit family amidase
MSGDASITDATGVELAGMIRRRDVSPVEVVEAFLRQIDAAEPIVNAFVTVCHEQALAAAREAGDALLRIDPSELPALHGMPIAVKDLTPTAGVRTTFGSRHFADHVPDEDGLIWQRLKAAGAILLGKTTTPEFGMHSITESPLTGITNNPWDPTRTVGGSSGGSAAALAARMTPLATGSDGGGSIRVPSSFCGTVGLKCSRGRIPIWSEGDPFETVDVVGPMTRTVADTALMLDICAGPHPYDPFALPDEPRDYLATATNADVSGLRIAFCPDLGNPPIEPAITDALDAAARMFESLGAHVETISISLPDPMEYFLGWWAPFVKMTLDDQVLGPTGGDAIESHPLFVEFASRADSMSAVDHLRLERTQRVAIHRAFADVFLQYDVLITATTPSVAFPHPGPDGGPLEVAGKRVSQPALDNQRNTEAISHAGYPALSVPVGFTPDGLPIGMQICGPHAADRLVIRVGAAYEAATNWHLARPREY